MDRFVAANEFPFRVGFTGHSGHLRLEPLPPVERRTPLKSLPDLILPPAFQVETPETIVKNVENEYLMPDLDQDEFRPDKCGRQWDFDWFDKAIVHLEPSLPRLTVVPVWEPPYRRAKKESFLKDNIKEQAGSENTYNKHPTTWIPNSMQIEVTNSTERARDSSSVLRRPGPPEDFVRGNTNNRPFRPGGFEDSQTSERCIPQGALNGDWIHEVLEGGPMQTCPPSFKQGLDLGVPKAFEHAKDANKEHSQTVYKSTIRSKVKILWRKNPSFWKTQKLKNWMMYRMQLKQKILLWMKSF